MKKILFIEDLFKRENKLLNGKLGLDSEMIDVFFLLFLRDLDNGYV